MARMARQNARQRSVLNRASSSALRNTTQGFLTCVICHRGMKKDVDYIRVCGMALGAHTFAAQRWGVQCLRPETPFLGSAVTCNRLTTQRWTSPSVLKNVREAPVVHSK